MAQYKEKKCLAILMVEIRLISSPISFIPKKNNPRHISLISNVARHLSHVLYVVYIYIYILLILNIIVMYVYTCNNVYDTYGN